MGRRKAEEPVREQPIQFLKCVTYRQDCQEVVQWVDRGHVKTPGHLADRIVLRHLGLFYEGNALPSSGEPELGAICEYGQDDCMEDTTPVGEVKSTNGVT